MCVCVILTLNNLSFRINSINLALSEETPVSSLRQLATHHILTHMYSWYSGSGGTFLGEHTPSIFCIGNSTSIHTSPSECLEVRWVPL